MNKTIIKGILEELEFTKTFGTYDFSYVAECVSWGDESLQITITDPSEPQFIQTASVKIGVVKDTKQICLLFTVKKQFWTKNFETWGNLIDKINEAKEFIETCTLNVIKSLG